MKENLLEKEYLTPAEVAGLFNVSPITVRSWSNNGWIKASKTPGKHRRYKVENVLKFANERHIELEQTPEKQRILIVDDEEGVRDTLVDLLEDLDNVESCEECEDGFSAGIKVHSYKPTTILLDIVLPGIDGVKVCQMIKNDPRTAHIRIIAMSGNATDEKIKDILDCGAELFIRKPINLETLAKQFE